MLVSLFLTSFFISHANAGMADTYQPSLPPEIAANTTQLLDLGIGGQSFYPVPQGISLNLPPAEDTLTFLSDQIQSFAVARIKVGPNQSYQMQDMQNGVAISPYKTRAELSMLGLSSSTYGEGNDRVYRIAVKLDANWAADESVDIFTQFKRASAGPDMFLGVKRQSVVLRIGRSGSANALQIPIIASIDRSRWAEIILAVHWSATPAGSVSIFYRYGDEQSYTRLADIKGPNLQSSTGNTYVKFGIYKPDNFPLQASAQAQQILDIGNISIFSLKGRAPASFKSKQHIGASSKS